MVFEQLLSSRNLISAGADKALVCWYWRASKLGSLDNRRRLILKFMIRLLAVVVVEYKVVGEGDL